ncbi:hypothetical protein Trydic_g6355 [Trypoxylus dichotomus]
MEKDKELASIPANVVELIRIGIDIWNNGHRSQNIFKEMPFGRTEFEDILEIIEATPSSLVSRKEKVPTPGFILEL